MATQKVCDLCRRVFEKAKGGGVLAWSTGEITEDEALAFLTRGERPKQLRQLDLCSECCENVAQLTTPAHGGVM